MIIVVSDYSALCFHSSFNGAANHRTCTVVYYYNSLRRRPRGGGAGSRRRCTQLRSSTSSSNRLNAFIGFTVVASQTSSSVVRSSAAKAWHSSNMLHSGTGANRSMSSRRKSHTCKQL
jgi:hypothetical protein